MPKTDTGNCCGSKDQIESALAKLANSAPQETEALPTKPDPKMAKALEILGVMQKRAEALPDSPARAEFLGNLSDARARADAGDGEGALVTLCALQTALKALETAPQDETTPEAAPSLEEKEWFAAFIRLESDVNAALSGGLVKDVDKLRIKWTRATGQATDGRYVEALARLAELERLLAARVEERASTPKSPLEYWNSGKATADEATALQ